MDNLIELIDRSLEIIEKMKSNLNKYNGHAGEVIIFNENNNN